MKRLVLAFVIVLTVVYGAKAFEFYDVSSRVVKELNAFRENPLAVSESLGLSLEDLSHAWNGYDWILQGLSPLKESDSLQLAAREKIRDMLERMYFSHASPDGITPKDLVKKFGFTPFFVGETLVYVAFENYIPVESAVDYLLKVLEKNALLRADAESAPILFPPYTHAGAALAVSRLDVNGTVMNVYLLCVEFGVRPGDWSVEDVFMFGKNFPESLLSIYGSDGLQRKPLVFPDGSYYLRFGAPGVYLFKVGDAVFPLNVQVPFKVDF